MELAVPYSTMKKTLGTTAPDTGRVKTITYGASGTGAETTAQYRSGWTYSFDTAGRRSTVTTAATGADARPGWSWGYNARGEVTSADRYDGSSTQALETFAYDAIGNRVNAKPTPGSGKCSNQQQAKHAPVNATKNTN